MLQQNKRSRRRKKAFLCAFVIAGFLRAVFMTAPAQAHDADVPTVLQGVAFEQRLGEQTPLDLPFVDESGKAVRFGDYFGTRPVVLNFVYYRCEDFCPLLIDGLVRTLRAVSLNLGDDFTVVTVSFDPRDTPADMLGSARHLGVADREDWVLGVASAEDVDLAVSLGYEFKIGPLEYADRMGLDVLLGWMEHLFHELGDFKYRPCPLLRKMVRAGHLGRKTGRGFFTYKGNRRVPPARAEARR